MSASVGIAASARLQLCYAGREAAPERRCSQRRTTARRVARGASGLVVLAAALQSNRVVPPRATRSPIVKAAAGEGEVQVENEAAGPRSLEEGLKELDRYLQPLEGTTGVKDEAAAVELAGRLKAAGLAPGFGGGRQVPKRIYTLEELRLNKIFPENLLSPKDKTLDGISDLLTLAAVLGAGSLAYALHLDASQVLGGAVAVLFALTADQIAAGGGVGALLLDTAGRLLNQTYKRRVAAHEAGHFLVAYLLGLLPQAYTLSAIEAYQRYKAFNVQAGTVFCDKDFQIEVATGKITSSTLDRYTCVALAGVATEYLQFGMAEGGMGDVQQLDGLLRALSFTQAKADGQIRWAVLNTIALLRQHEAVHKQLADAMLEGVSVGDAIAVVEAGLRREDLAVESPAQGQEEG